MQFYTVSPDSLTGYAHRTPTVCSRSTHSQGKSYLSEFKCICKWTYRTLDMITSVDPAIGRRWRTLDQNFSGMPQSLPGYVKTRISAREVGSNDQQRFNFTDIVWNILGGFKLCFGNGIAKICHHLRCWRKKILVLLVIQVHGLGYEM